MLTQRIDVAFATRRFPPPWIVEEHNDACFIVRDAAGQALKYFYFEDEPGRCSATNQLTATSRGASPPLSCRSCCKSGAEANQVRSRRGAVLSVAALWLAVREADDATRL